MKIDKGCVAWYICYFVVWKKMATDGCGEVMYDEYEAIDKEAFDVYEAYYRRSNENEMFVSALDEITSEYNLDFVKSCLAVGPNDGFREIAFFEKCATNATKFVAIEIGHDSSEHLKVQLTQRLPDVEGLVIEGDFRSWKGPSDRVDLIMMFNCLYSNYFKDHGERQSLLRKAHDSWLNPGGFLAVLSAGSWSTKSPGKAGEIVERLGKSYTKDPIEADILEAGFIKKHEHEIQHMRDFSNPDEALLLFYQSNTNYSVTLDDVRSVMKELYPDGKAIGVHTLAVFQKAV